AEEELVAVEVWEEAGEPSRGEVLARQPEGVADGEAEQTPDDRFARKGHAAFLLWCGRPACIACTIRDAPRFPKWLRDAGGTPAPQQRRRLPPGRAGAVDEALRADAVVVFGNGQSFAPALLLLVDVVAGGVGAAHLPRLERTG